MCGYILFNTEVICLSHILDIMRLNDIRLLRLQSYDIFITYVLARYYYYYYDLGQEDIINFIICMHKE